MSRQHWILRDAEGKIRGGVITHGPTPTEEGSNPDGFTEQKVSAIGDLAANPEFTVQARAARLARARRRLERQLGADGLELLAELVAKKLRG